MAPRRVLAGFAALRWLQCSSASAATAAVPAGAASSTKSRRNGSAKLGEALITSIVGPAAARLHRALARRPGLAFTHRRRAREMRGRVRRLLGGFVGLACLISHAGAASRPGRGRQLEEDALRQPPTRARATAAAATPPAAGRRRWHRASASCFRSGSSRSRDSPVNSQTRQDLDSYLTTRRRASSRARGGGGFGCMSGTASRLRALASGEHGAQGEGAC